MKGSGESKANRRLTQDSSACCQKSCFFEGTTVHALMIFPFLCKNKLRWRLPCSRRCLLEKKYKYGEKERDGYRLKTLLQFTKNLHHPSQKSHCAGDMSIDQDGAPSV